MGRGGGRQNMQLIADERSRRVTFQNRKKCILKKAYEFSTLCDVDACVIIYGPSKPSDHRRRQPAELSTWPENRDEVNRIIEKFNLNNNKPAPIKHLQKGRNKNAKVSKLKSDVRESKYPTWDERIDEFSEQQLEELASLLDRKIDSGKRSRNNKGHRMPLSNGQHSSDCHSHMFQYDSGLNSTMGYQERLYYDPSGGNQMMIMHQMESVPSSSTRQKPTSYPMNMSSISSQMINYQVEDGEDDDMICHEMV